MRLYYPTTSLNFNDLLASESISPKRFYKDRKFGTTRHFETELSLDENFLTLFNIPPYFKLVDVQDSEYEEYPMIVELSLGNEINLKQISEHVFVTSSTLFFDLNNVKFRFFSEEHLKKILIKSRVVEEVKLIIKYRDKFNLISKESLKNVTLNGLQIPVITRNEPLNKYDEDLHIYNRMKGFLYAYLIKSFKKHDSSEILENIAKALEQAKKLPEPFNYFVEDCLKNAETNTKRALENISKKELFVELIKEISKSKEIKINEFLFTNDKELKIYEFIINSILSKKVFNSRELLKDEVEVFLKNIEAFINEQIGVDLDYSSDISKIIQRITNRDFNIEINQITSVVLKNLLLFILKNKKIDELEKMVEQNQIEKSFLAYGILGAFVGFSSLSKTITNDLYYNYDLLVHLDNKSKEIREMLWNTNIKEDSNQNNLENEHNQLYSGDLFSLLNKDDDMGLRKQIYNHIQRIRQSKILHSYLKSSVVKLENQTIVTFKEGRDEVKIFFEGPQEKKAIVILSKNVSDQELRDFKEHLIQLGFNKSVAQGNYPVFKYIFENKDSDQIVWQANELFLIESFNLLL
ncbi:hypothetical protein [Paenibacillus sp.]|uniref:hypothetical protein n=1 Tax=Paenibacillus sp. TaxID=58172 RepID=UPI003561EC84